MRWIGVLAAAAVIGVMLLDAFEAMILPRRVSHGWRPARLFYRTTWLLWHAVACRIPHGRKRLGFLGMFGPLSMLGLIAMWAVCLILGFALLHWCLDTLAPESVAGFGTYAYFSAVTFFTLGYGDLVPVPGIGRVLSVVEAGLGFAFLAVVISYLPVLYQAFSRREITISLLDARAGSPPTAGELLRRLATSGDMAGVGPLLAEWERWAAELLESHISYSVLSFYRSQHDNQSWIAALTAILDTSALLIADGARPEGHQARLTFAMARHAAVDLGLVFSRPPLPPDPDRLPPAEFARLRESLAAAGLVLRGGPGMEKALAELRGLYEPFVNALAAYFLHPLPPVQHDRPPVDNWQTSAWMRRSPGLSGLPAAGGEDEHFD
jgi:hypothetical protein